jgi:hypothetical protein
VRNARGCDVAAIRIADNRSVSICPGEASAHIVRDVRSWIGLKYLG